MKVSQFRSVAKTLGYLRRILNIAILLLQDYFEPFEKRAKPVTLIAFRKNGFVPRHTFKVGTDIRISNSLLPISKKNLQLEDFFA